MLDSKTEDRLRRQLEQINCRLRLTNEGTLIVPSGVEVYIERWPLPEVNNVREDSQMDQDKLA